MTRRRRTSSYRRSRYSSRNDKRMRGAERILFIVGATLYVVGLFGGLSMLEMPAMTATMLLALGGGMLLALALMFVF